MNELLMMASSINTHELSSGLPKTVTVSFANFCVDFQEHFSPRPTYECFYVSFLVDFKRTFHLRGFWNRRQLKPGSQRDLDKKRSDAFSIMHSLRWEKTTGN